MKNIFTILCVISMFAYGCGSSGTTQESSDNSDSTEISDIREKVEREFMYPIPTSYQVTQLLQDAEASFVLGITNSPENVDKYETQKDKALNLGIYGADLSYASTYNRQEETMSFLNASKQLVDDLQLSSIFTVEMVSRIENNLSNKDSLILIVTESFYDTYEYLNKDGQNKLSLLVVAGSWIEGLYITTQLAISSNYDVRIMDIVSKQKGPANQLFDLLSKHSGDDDVSAVLPFLNYLKETYAGIDENTPLTQEQLDNIYNNVDKTRSAIVGES